MHEARLNVDDVFSEGPSLARHEVSLCCSLVHLHGPASRSMRAYFLGGNDLPWYMLGLSNASGMFDIAGTMWMVSALYVYGLKSIWLPWLWPVFNQVFLAAYLSQW